MADRENTYCPECEDATNIPEPPPVIGRRNFLVAAGAAAATVSLVGQASAADTATTAKAEVKPRPAEELIRELYTGLKDEQKKKVVLAYNHGAEGKGKKTLSRKQISPNRAAMGITLDSVYTKAQQELIERIVKAMSNGEDGFRQISRGGTWDASRTFGNCGALIFGDPTVGNKFSFLFTGHHLTIRCDGDTEEGPAFGGPIYYGHTPNGYSKANVFSYQTRSTLKVFEALTEKQREKAVVKRGNPGEGENSVQFKAKAEDRPGIRYEDLTKDQKPLIEQVMRDVLKPYRKEDVDEVMAIIKKNGGMEKIQLAFYPDSKMDDKEPWHFWRLEGPGFVWNYRVLPHVHTYVNISSKLAGA